MPHITSLGKVEIQNMVSDDQLPYLHHHSQKNPKLEQSQGLSVELRYFLG
jgi:hypothetical protein